MFLKVTTTDGSTNNYKVSPALRFAFEQHHKKGWTKAFTVEGMESDIYWLVWEAKRQAGEVVKPFGAEFVSTLQEVEIEAEGPNG